ncbi:type II secretion system minor pseudopilin GspH [Psychromonas sp. KJ10-10]|uniref:type II secretion system minor pseudopilin GspH n=1 Tax=Psychromonas sp. KJ10-10 TaxID=3391823 RepID=UPI0039B43705
MRESFFKRGFTLLEIMLVLLLIGMASVAVVMVMPKYINNNESVDWQLQRFSSLLQFAEDEALISGKEIGLVFDKNSYRFTVFDYKTTKWLALESEQFAKEIEIPESISIEYELLGTVWDEIDVEDEDVFIDEEYLVDIEGDDQEIQSFSPQVYIMSNGEVTPFKVFLSETDKQSGALEISMSGMITHIEAEVQ